MNSAPLSARSPTAGRDNAFLADRLDEIADLLEVQDANPFRVRAYRNGARMARRYGIPIAERLARGEDITDLPGIGRDLAGKIADLCRDGTTELLEQLRREVPRFVVEMLAIPGIGPKRAMTLWRVLNVRNREHLQRACLDGRVRTTPKLGKAVESALLAGLAAAAPAPARLPIVLAAPVAERLAAFLRDDPGVAQVEVAGSYRRGRETVGDLDILATTGAPAACIERFCGYTEVARIIARGPTRATVVLTSGLQVDLRAVAPAEFGSALQYLTGSKAHSIALRRRAQQQGLKLNEYGVFRGPERLAGETEAEVYSSLGLPWIPPELRENRGEIEAAAEARLPRLVEAQDLKGDLHVHVGFDNAARIDAFVRSAAACGYTYLGLVEQASRLRAMHDADAAGLQRVLTRLPGSQSGVHLLRVVECDIGEDGRLDLLDVARDYCDLVIGAVHSAFHLSREAQTRRVLTALADPALRIVSHPSRRLVERDAPYDLDMGAVIRASARAGVWVEITSDPARLDIGDLDCRIARDAGALVALSSEASEPEALPDIRFALSQGRRGWLESSHVLNARPWTQLHRMIERRRTGAARNQPGPYEVESSSVLGAHRSPTLR